ncbi:MAG: sensor histidine kinase [Actinomycetota bacterium]
MSESVRERAERWWHRIFDDPSPLIKQAPTAIAVLMVVFVMGITPGLNYSNVGFALSGITLVTVATVYAGSLSVRRIYEGWVVLLVPMADIIGLGLVRTGTGGPNSLFSSLVLLPVIWLAAAPGIRYVFAVAVFTAIALMMPYIVDPPTDQVVWLRGVIGPLVFAAVAAVINELSRQQRLRVRQAEGLVTQRTEALSKNLAMVAQLRESENEYRTLLDSFQSLWSSITAQAVIATDRSGKISAWNPGAERLLGLTEAQALDGVRIDRFFPKQTLAMLAEDYRSGDDPYGVMDLPIGLQALFARADSDRAPDEDLEVTTAGGTRVPARATVTRRTDGTGRQRGYLFVITDETRAAEVARMKDEFVGMISHELRTPLSAIIGFLDLLQNDPGQPLTEEQQEFVGIIERNAQRLLNLVGDLLFTAQVESGHFPLERVETDLGAIARSAVASAGPHALREGIDLHADVPASPVMIAIDAGRIGQALDNLLSNAIKFTPRGGRVTVRVQTGDGYVELAVSDTGVGIPADEQGLLFTRFFRASTATRNAVPGVGLGLTITRAIVIAHGGSMEVTSEEGAGTEFRIRLLLAPRTEALYRVRPPA